MVKEWRPVTWLLFAWAPAWFVIGVVASPGGSENNVNAWWGFVIWPAIALGLVGLAVVWFATRNRAR